MARRSETLARFALFRSLGKDLIQRLDSQCIWRRASADEWLVEYEDDSVDIYFVAYGRLRVTIRLISGTEIILRDLGEGEFFGELAALDGRSRSAGVVAMTDSVIARVAPGVFRAVVHEHAAVCDQLLAQLAAQVRTLAARVTELSTLDVRHRIYSELLRLSRAEADEGEAKITPPPTHAELAARVSTHREAVSRELKSLERAGLIERRRGAIALEADRTLRAHRKGVPLGLRGGALACGPRRDEPPLVAIRQPRRREPRGFCRRVHPPCTVS